MPKHHTRSSSGSHNRYATQHIPVTVDPAAMYAQQRMTMPAAYYAVASSSASAMTLPPQPQTATYDPYSTVAAVQPPVVSMPPTQHRASSGAWTHQDDQQLITARMQGLNWAQIKDTYFPSKTGNACRKRHERLMDRKGSDDWDARKLQRFAQDYMSLRREIWSPLAERTGEKWQVVEQKCLSNGLKNLQSAARAAARRDRLESSAPLSGYDDDSGVSGIGLTPVDELDASYSSPETNSSGPHSAGPSYLPAGSHQHHAHHHHAQQLHPHAQAHLQPLATGHSGYGMGGYGGGNGYHGYSSSVSSSASHGYPGSQGSSPYMQGQRQSSADMGIEAIINRPPGRRVA